MRDLSRAVNEEQRREADEYIASQVRHAVLSVLAFGLKGRAAIREWPAAEQSRVCDNVHQREIQGRQRGRIEATRNCVGVSSGTGGIFYPEAVLVKTTCTTQNRQEATASTPCLFLRIFFRCSPFLGSLLPLELLPWCDVSPFIQSPLVRRISVFPCDSLRPPGARFVFSIAFQAALQRRSKAGAAAGDEVETIAVCIPMTSRGTVMNTTYDSPVWTHAFSTFLSSTDWRAPKFRFHW